MLIDRLVLLMNQAIGSKRQDTSSGSYSGCCCFALRRCPFLVLISRPTRHRPEEPSSGERYVPATNRRAQRSLEYLLLPRTAAGGACTVPASEPRWNRPGYRPHHTTPDEAASAPEYCRRSAVSKMNP